MGLALDLWNRVEIETAATDIQVSYVGSDAIGMDGRENLLGAAMRQLAEEHGRELPPFHLTAQIDVPVARGLGSSAAAIVAGLIAGNYLLDLGLGDDQIFQAAARMEGHGDNVGAALHGGAILSVRHSGRALKLTDGADLDLTTVVYIPDEHGATWVCPGRAPAARRAGRCGVQRRRGERDRGRSDHRRPRGDRGRHA